MIGEDVGVTNHAIHLRNLDKAGVNIRVDQRLVQIEKHGNRLSARFRHEYSGREGTELYDQIVVDAGTVPDESLYYELQQQSINNGLSSPQALLDAQPQPDNLEARSADRRFSLYRIGDCVSARGIHAAMLDAQRLCRGL